MEECGEVVGVNPRECSVKGGEHVVLTFCNPVAVPDEDVTFLYFCGSRDRHKVSMGRHSPNSLVASVPRHSTAETVELNLCCVDDRGLEKTLYKTHFTYFFDQKAFMADLMLQSASDGGSSLQVHYGLFSPLSSADAVRDYDMYLTEALSEAKIPEGWSMVGSKGRHGQRISAVDDCKPRETLLHFAARHGLNCFAQHLLSLPGASYASLLPNEEGKIPIQMARDNNNAGLIQLLALYMKQVGPDGQFMKSPSPSPQHSPNHVLVRGGVQAGGDMRRLDRLDRNVQELVRINEGWRNQVRRHRKYSPTTGLDLAPSQQWKTDLSHRLSRRRRSLCAFISVPPKEVVGGVASGDSEHLECVNRVQDPEIMEMDRLRRISWSATVGATDSRSIDTGLNELHRITAEEVLQKRLLSIRSELMELEQGSKTSNQMGLIQSQIILRSLSCPMLDKSDDEEDDDESASPTVPKRRVAMSSFSASAILSTSPQPSNQDLTSSHSHLPYRHYSELDAGSDQVIPTVITTKYSVGSCDLDLHSDMTSLSASVDDLENSSGDQLDSRDPEERERDVTRDERSVSLLARLEDDGMLAGYSISAPDLLEGLSDTEDRSPAGAPNSKFLAAAAVSVEDSIVEHRSLRQQGAYSPASDEMRDTGTDQTNTSVDSDFVIVLSPNPQAAPRQDEEPDGSDKEPRTLTQSVEVTKRPVKSARQGKTHRRSLSTSDVESMRDLRASGDGEEEERAAQIREEEESGHRPSTSSNCVAVLTPLSNGGELESSARRRDIDEHSQADSVQTLDTSSHRGSDESSEGENGETDDHLSALDSQVSVDAVTSDRTACRAQVSYNGVSNISPVVLRGRRRQVNPLNRYSAECLITNIDDDFGMESDDGGETTPTTVMVSRFSRRRPVNSTSAPLSTVSHSDSTEHEDFDGPQNLSNLSPSSTEDRKESVCGSDSVFANGPEGEVLNLSDVDVKMNDDSTVRNSFEQSGELDEKFYSQSGFPKTIRKKSKKPSISGRKKVSPKLEKKGLNAADVSPTVRHLRKLIDLEELEDSYSDDSDTTVGSGPVRTSSALGRMSVSSIQRSKSSVSDSVMLQPQHRVTVSFASTVPNYRSDSPGARSPLQLDTPSDHNEGSSLDFASGSPLASTRMQQQLQSQLVQPASPLSFATKSPPTSSHALSSFSIDRNREMCNSSPAFLVSPTAGNITPDTASLDAELQQEHRPPVAQNQLPRQYKRSKFEKSKSLHESGTEAVSFFVDPKEVVEEGKPLEKDIESSSSVKKFIRGSFFRGSKQTSKKVVKGGGGSENDQEIPITSHSKRIKSAKLRSKHSESSLEAFPSSPSGSITRSTSMQVGLQDDTMRESKPTSHMTRYNSDDVLSSPSKIRSAHSLSVLEEIGAFPFPPPQHVSGGESDEALSNMDQLLLSTNHPELHLKEELVWERTVDRKFYKKINKSERERQAILHELLHTEKQHFRALHVLKLIFRQGISKHVSEENLSHLFPKLEELIAISKDFITRMEKKKTGNMITDLSDVLLKQFSGGKYDQMLVAFSGFCSGHLDAMEIYRELCRKKHFTRLMNELHSVKECQRLTLPDYYTKVTQRLSQLITLMNRLAKKTESLKLDHSPVLLKSMSGLQHLVAAVDQGVEDSKNLIELMDIQSRLEINVPKSSKVTNRQDLKNMSLTGGTRKLKKRGDALWMGHGRQLSVQIVLVTDFLVLLTERDQKFHLAALQDLKPPVIRLYDLMVRPNVSVKSGVQLLLVEQSSTPEMYKLDFVDKKKAKQWLSSLNAAIEECKERGLKCECFGAEGVTSGDEDKKPEEKEAVAAAGEGGEEGKAARAVPTVLPSKSDPEVHRHKLARETIELAKKLLGIGVPMPADQDPVTNARLLNLRQRSQTVRPKTAYYFSDETDGGGGGGGSAGIVSSCSSSGDHVISHPQLVSQPARSKTVKEKEKKKVTRSSTFRNKEKKEEKEKLSGLVGAAHPVGNQSEENHARSEQLYATCINALKSSLEEVLTESEGKTTAITKLQDEVLFLQKSLKHHKRKEQNAKKQTILAAASPTTNQQSPCTSPPPLPSLSPPQTTSVGLSELEHEVLPCSPPSDVAPSSTEDADNRPHDSLDHRHAKPSGEENQS